MRSAFGHSRCLEHCWQWGSLAAGPLLAAASLAREVAIWVESGRWLKSLMAVAALMERNGRIPLSNRANAGGTSTYRSLLLD